HKNPDNFVRNGRATGLIEGFSCQIIVDEAVDWLTRKKSDSPFFLFVAFHEPHEPIASPSAIVNTYQSVARSNDEAEYFGNVENMDLAVGKLTAAMEELNLLDNTIIVFTSDNGPETLNRYRSANRSYGQPGPLRGMKLHTTEAGFRVPGIVSWKGHLPEDMIGSTNNTPISSLDLLPTFCELAQLTIPKEPELDGVSIKSLLLGKNVSRKKPLVWAYYNAINDARVAMRYGQWKVLAKLNEGSVKKLTNLTAESLPLVRDAKLTNIEIYDLSVDLSEQNNLSGENKKLTRELASLLQQEYQKLVEDSHVW
ncbi:MAG: sulfatase-like hydrolase/transferase, partial [Planctomycetota bacterium]|nr:sulfatase-like hydrolase/transferase [Planctomycetota bacterium]